GWTEAVETRAIEERAVESAAARVVGVPVAAGIPEESSGLAGQGLWVALAGRGIRGLRGGTIAARFWPVALALIGGARFDLCGGGGLLRLVGLLVRLGLVPEVGLAPPGGLVGIGRCSADKAARHRRSWKC